MAKAADRLLADIAGDAVLSDGLVVIGDAYGALTLEAASRGARGEIEDHVIRVTERVDAFRQILQNAQNAHTALVGQRTLGYPFALLLMLGMGVGLYFVFKRKGWI